MTIHWRIVKKKLSDLRELGINPRTLSKNQYDQLSTSISKFGLIDKPIITSDGLIIGGHQRKKVLEMMGVKEVDCYVPDKELTQEEIEELCIRLNKNTGEWDWDILANHWNMEDLVEWGFDPLEFSGFDCGEPQENDTAQESEKKAKKCCPACGHEF